MPGRKLVPRGPGRRLLMGLPVFFLDDSEYEQQYVISQ